MQFPIRIGLHRSRILDRILWLTGALAASAIALTPWPLLWRIALFVVTVLIVRHAWRAAKPPVDCLWIDNQGRLAVQSEAGQCVVHIIGTPYLHHWLTAFAVEDAEGQRHRLHLTVDSTSPEEFRQLRVCLGLNWLSADLGADV